MSIITLLGNPGVLEGKGGKKGNRRYYVKEVYDQKLAIIGGIYAITQTTSALTSEMREKLGTIVMALDHQHDPVSTRLIERQADSGLRLHHLHQKIRKEMADMLRHYQIEQEEVHVVLESQAQETAAMYIDPSEMRCGRKAKRDTHGNIVPGCNATTAGYLLAAIQRSEPAHAVQAQAFWQLDKNRVKMKDVASGGRLAADILCRQNRGFILQNSFLSLHGEVPYQALGICSDIFKSDQSELLYVQSPPRILMTAEMFNK